MTDFTELERLLRYFAYDHLPEQLQSVSKPFHDLAHELFAAGGRAAETIHIQLDSDEVAVALRKLLEAKDCAVRAALRD